MKHYAELPHNDRGAYLQLSRGIQRFDVRPDPKDVPSGTYKLRIRAGAVKGSDPSRHFIEIGHPQKLNGTSPGFTKLLSTQPISGTIEAPEIIEVKVEIGASTPREFGIQERQPKSAKLLRQEFDRHKQKNGYGTPPAIWVDWIELEGPITEVDVTESTIVRVEPEKTINPDNEKEIAQIEDTYKRFTQWQAGVDKAAAMPENKAKIAELSKKEPAITHPIHFYRFAHLLNGTPDPGGGDHHWSQRLQQDVQTRIGDHHQRKGQIGAEVHLQGRAELSDRFRLGASLEMQRVAERRSSIRTEPTQTHDTLKYNLSLFLLFVMTAPVAAEPPRNIVLILADDLDWADTTLHGKTLLYETPNIERLAAHGMTFSFAFESPITSPHRPSIMIGQNSARYGMTVLVAHLEVER